MSIDVKDVKNEILPIFNAINDKYIKDCYIKRMDEDIIEEKVKNIRRIPFKYEEEFVQFEKLRLNKTINYKEYVNFFKKLCKISGHPFSEKYWNVNYVKEKEILIIKECKKLLENMRKQWEEEIKNIIIKELKERYKPRLGLLKKLKELLLSIGGSNKTSLFWDNSKGELLTTDIKNLEKYINLLEKNEIRKLADLLGKLLKSSQDSKELSEKIRKKIEIKVPVFHMQEEVIGVKFSDELENIVPSELAILNDKDLEVLFDINYLEHNLMCYDYIGEDKKEKIIEEQKVSKVKGPFILCVDTSGSMQGVPENVSKAITLYLTTKALEEEREVSIVNFSTSIEEVSFNSKSGINSILKFLGKSFHSGTDLYPALEFSLKKIQEKNFKNADILVISDFIMGTPNQKMLELVENIRKLDSKLYSLGIGNLFINENLNTIFDKQYVFNGETSSISVVDRLYKNIDEN